MNESLRSNVLAFSEKCREILWYHATGTTSMPLGTQNKDTISQARIAISSSFESAAAHRFFLSACKLLKKAVVSTSSTVSGDFKFDVGV